MANRAFLIKKTGIDKEAGSDDIICASNYSIPFLWLTIFSPEDIQTKRIELLDDDDKPFEEEALRIITDVENVKRRIKQNKSFVENAIDIKNARFYEYWSKIFDDLFEIEIEMNIDEIMIMSNDYEKFNSDIIKMIVSVYNKKIDNELFEHYSNIKALNNIIQNSFSKEFPVTICGYGWNDPYQWEDN
jgi:hypothetical protein